MVPAGQVFDRAFLTDVEGVTEIVFVRHGEQYVADPRGGPVGDIIDPPLSDRGWARVRLVGERYSTEKVDVVYASPLHRALETGSEIARHHRLEPKVMPDLREVEIFRDIPPDKTAVEVIGRDLLLGILERMLRERKWDVYPYSESSAEFRKRVVNAVEGSSRSAGEPGDRGVPWYDQRPHGHIIGSPYDMFCRPARVREHRGRRKASALRPERHIISARGESSSRTEAPPGDAGERRRRCRGVRPSRQGWGRADCDVAPWCVGCG
jgi:broad specificity phosphatase PhoE